MIRILKEEPVISVIAEMELNGDGINEMAEWVRSRRPECMPDEYRVGAPDAWVSLFPRSLISETANELLVELPAPPVHCLRVENKTGRKIVKLVIIESPYKGDVPRNLRYLRSCIRDCLSRGESPYASHRMLTDALDDDSPAERALGIAAGLAWRNASGVLPVFYVDLGWSNGMWEAQAIYDDEERSYEIRLLPKDDPFFKEAAPTVSPPAPIVAQDETARVFLAEDFYAEGEVPK